MRAHVFALPTRPGMPLTPVRPSCPSVLAPHVQRVPSPLMATENAYPPATALAPAFKEGAAAAEAAPTAASAVQASAANAISLCNE